ncbi:MAG TPA: dihydroorotase [Flavobacteriales bacterium]|nr:dihydroorotase [Flavobacteriales bacterium]
MSHTLIQNASIVNEGEVFVGSVLIENDTIAEVSRDPNFTHDGAEIIDATGLFLIPGAIDDQVHFREPGLTHKAEIYTESKAAVAGGVTTYMEMPNTNPQTTTQAELEKKFKRASDCSLANFSFFFGATNDNLEEVLATDANNVCGIKIFMGSSTGNMLVDRQETLANIFSKTPMLIATHCEDEVTVRVNSARYKAQFGDQVPFTAHPLIRSAEACYISSSAAVALAKKYDTRLHILHISTAKECTLFTNDIPLSEKRITAEACIHHLWFNDSFYPTKGSHIKWNPAVKTEADRLGIWEALLDNRIDVIATDHAPHTLEEKSGNYWDAPSGGPLVQHSVLAMMDFVKSGQISVERMVEKMSHAVAELFQIRKRGYIRKGYFADLVLVDPKTPTTVSKTNLLYKCGWSPFEGHTFSSSINRVFVNGHEAYTKGAFDESKKGSAITFSR